MNKKDRVDLTYKLKTKFQVFNGLLFAKTKKYGWVPTSDDRKFNFYRDIISKIGIKIQPESTDINQMIKTLTQISDIKRLENTTCIHTPHQIINVLNGEVKENKIDGVQLGIKYDYNKFAKKVEWWDEMLEKTIPDEDSRTAYYEMIGLSMIPDKRMEVSYWFTGEAGTGKSTIVNSVINGIHHDYNTSKLQPENWKTKDFTFFIIANKLVNISSDSSDNKKLETGMFKKLASGEDVIADIKNLYPITFANTALLVSVGNNMPVITEKSNGPFRRMIPIPINRVLKDSEKKKGLKLEILKNKDGVLEYIVSKSIEAVIELYKRDAPTIPHLSNQAIEKLKTDNSSIRIWLNEEDTMTKIESYENGTSAYGLPFSMLGETYNSWARLNGYSSINLNNIRKQVREAISKGFNKNLEIYKRNNKIYLRTSKGSKDEK